MFKKKTKDLLRGRPLWSAMSINVCRKMGKRCGSGTTGMGEAIMTATAAVGAFRNYAIKKVAQTTIWHWVVFFIVALFVITPVIMLILGSFSQASLPVDFSLDEMGWDN